MALIPEDPHSVAKPEQASVTYINLELSVDFRQRVLRGRATLTIEKKASISEITLDCHKLKILDVQDLRNGRRLKYNFRPFYLIASRKNFGWGLVIKIPETNEDNSLCPNTLTIQIEYETYPKSPALRWIKATETADGLHPFLISTNTLIHARSLFPCQDTPSVKFRYAAQIVVEKEFTVIMSASLLNETVNDNVKIFKFCQTNRVSSYAVVIVVGYLQKISFGIRSVLFSEPKFFNDDIKTFHRSIEELLQIAESLCGPYPWGKYNVCVLPPCVSHFEIECPCVAFVSPYLLKGDISLFSSIVQNIASNWAGSLVSCANYDHFWLNKSFNIFISRKIMSKMLIHIDIKQFLEKLGMDELRCLVEDTKDTILLQTLIPHLKGRLPGKEIPYVPYEMGYKLLDQIERLVGGQLIFERFLKSYFANFAFQSITTSTWKEYLYDYFPNGEQLFSCINWDEWFFTTNFKIIHFPLTKLEKMCTNVLKEWIKWDISSDISSDTCTEIMSFLDIQKLLLLSLLYILPNILVWPRLRLLSNIFESQDQSYEIRFHWLRVCIKFRWEQKYRDALNFAIEYRSYNYTTDIFQDLSEIGCPILLQLLREKFEENKIHMTKNTQNKLNEILYKI